MFLRRLEIDDIRAIEHLDLSFAAGSETRHWTLILGENGTGKSTVLKAIALALAGSDALPELMGDPNDWIRRGARTGRIRVDLVTADDEHRTVELLLRRSTKLGIFEDNRDTLAQLDAAIAHTPRNYFTAGYGVTRRADPRRQVTTKGGGLHSPRADAVATLFSTDETLTPLETWVMDLDYRRKDGLRLAKRTLNTLLPGIDLVRIDRERRELIFRTPDGLLPYRLLSDGYQHAAAWIGDLLAVLTEVFQDYRDPLSARGLLLVDEVDLHLHPVWQRELQRFLTSHLPHLQLVCTTHSPLTAHQTGEGELFALRRNGAGAPVLEAFQGAANTLMLHQFMAAPVFGFESVDSEPVERIKAEYRVLRDQPKHTKPERERLTELAGAIEALPSWSDADPTQDMAKAQIERIERQLEA